MNQEFFYRFDGLGLVAGNKTAGFILWLSSDAAKKLLNCPITEREYESITMQMRDRVLRGKLLSKRMVSDLGFSVVNNSACPLVFSTSPFGGSLSFNPNELDWLGYSEGDDEMVPAVQMTPHNVDAPAQALALVVMVETWAEWAYGKLVEIAQNEVGAATRAGT